MQFHKLVRDNIPDIIRRDGEVPKFHIADKPEYQKKLFEKLTEETQELQTSQDVADELVDILEIIYAISDYYSISRRRLESCRKMKALKRGTFNRRIVLDETIRRPA